jgi:RNA polymerase sigma factor (sigma-70 family)
MEPSLEQTPLVNEPLDNVECCWAQVPDEELLELVQRSKSRDAMTQLMERHASLVASVIARNLRQASVREEAFQATFLVLFQSAHKIRKKSSLASFLFGVAFRVSRRLRDQEARNVRKLAGQENQNVETHATDTASDPFETLAKRLQTAVLDEELEALPDSLRAPLVEHYMAGKTAAEIADSMGLSVSAVEGRIKRGKQVLRSKLAYRGVSLTACLVAMQSQSCGINAAEVAGWTDSVVQLGVDPEFNSSILVSDQHKTLRNLVQGELQMKSFTSPSWLFWSGSVCLIALVGLGMLQVTNGGTPAVEQLASSEGTEVEIDAGNDGSILMQVATVANGGDSGAAAPRQPEVAKPEVVAWTKDPDAVPGWLVQNADNQDQAGKLRIEQKLNEALDGFASNNQPLSLVLEKLSETMGIDIIIDDKALDNEGISPDEPVTINRRGSVKVKDVLRQALNPLDCTYTFEYGALVVTTKASYSSNVLGYYDLSYVFPDNSISQDLIAAIERSVTPVAWETNSGTSTMSLLGSMLIVRAPPETQEELSDFLRQISNQSKENLKPSGLNQPPVMMQGGMGGMGGGMM